MLHFESISDPSSDMNKNMISYKFIGKKKQLLVRKQLFMSAISLLNTFVLFPNQQPFLFSYKFATDRIFVHV